MFIYAFLTFIVYCKNSPFSIRNHSIINSITKYFVWLFCLQLILKLLSGPGSCLIDALFEIAFIPPLNEILEFDLFHPLSPFLLLNFPSIVGNPNDPFSPCFLFLLYHRLGSVESLNSLRSYISFHSFSTNYTFSSFTLACPDSPFSPTPPVADDLLSPLLRFSNRTFFTDRTF